MLAANYPTPTKAWEAHKRTLGRDLLISNLNGNRPISRKAAEKYAVAFGVSAGWILYGDPPAESADAAAAKPATSDLKRMLEALAELPDDEIDRLLGRAQRRTPHPAGDQPENAEAGEATAKPVRRKNS